MGTVFEVENLSIGRTVAVKVLHPNQAKKKIAVKRFHQEARAAGAIGHPNICEVYDLGSLEDGSPYLVMERLVGETLADRIATEGGLPFEDVIDILLQVLAALVAAHSKGIVHRDIKPENVFLSRREGLPPVAKLLDFGVSKMLAGFAGGEDLDLTRTGMVMGTPFYMSPEQARGDRNLDARVDLWACGVILYEALTGRRPFIASNYNALLLQILTIAPRAARELRPALPKGFDEIIARAMARGREGRYSNAGDFQADLRVLRDRHFKSAAGTRRQSDPRAPHSRRRDDNDPLSRLPALAGSDSIELQAAPQAPDDGSGTHIALHLSELDSGEFHADGPPPEAAPGFDNSPTEIHRKTEDWDDETTQRPIDAAKRLAALRRPRPSPAPKLPAHDLEQTVKIEGDVEAHFREVAAKDKKKPRLPQR